MKCTYYLAVGKYTDENGEQFSTFGIGAKSKEGGVLQKYSDLFLDREKAEHLVALCNDLELSALHLKDVAEDALIEKDVL